MKVHEYQAKALLAAQGVPIPRGVMVTSKQAAIDAARQLIEETGNPVVAVKSQIHAGGRGKGTFKEHPDVRGVNVVKDGPEAVGSLAERMLGSTLVTIQTGERGKQVTRLYIEQGVVIDRELYLAVLLDRSVGRNLVMASTEGGMEIERVAEETPEKILREVIDPAGSFPGQCPGLGIGPRRRRSSELRGLHQQAL
jgi:succinyl-CoA synthetase beta subunit